ncbi:GNAT family N-acetyltransferase [Streptomyces sp. NPDC090106]|uniref:GNAT family N-acetyltransferase n=1 Tax=Streptomyces sp. NPDC090106 TaxID=3365946 RepID=UPI0038082487
MEHKGGERVAEAVAGAVAVLRTAVDRDWKAVRAGRVEWSCHETAVHIAQDLIVYAGRLASRVQDAYRPFDVVVDDSTDNARALQLVEGGGALLAATVRTTPPRVRAYHPRPFLSANPEGFAALAVGEVLLHTHDIAEGLELVYEPPGELAEFVLTRMFPHVRPDADHWRTLLWATGRGELPGREPVTGDWAWYNNLVLDTGRLTLEALTPAAALDLHLGGDGGFAWVEDGPFEGTRQASGMLAKAYEEGTHRPGWGVFVLVRRDDGRAVGGMGFHSAPDEDGRAEVGYDLAPSARGRGYATEALAAMTEWALAQDGVRSLVATIDHDNAASQRVVARTGFRRAPAEEERAVNEERDHDQALRLYVRHA